ncbi:MAG TPA: CPBP family intramembrane metalloprotease, partial [Spirochaetales bacterium]|nr:CPBP family intramembrane metalloprotease [Spirochaetales bacterium]
MSRGTGRKGFWELPGKNPALGAFLGTTLIVALYGLAGSSVLGAYLLADLSFLEGGDWKELGSKLLARYRVPILASTALFQFLFFGGMTYLLFRRWHAADLRERFRLRRPGAPSLILAVLGAAGLLPLALGAGELFMRAFPFLKELSAQSENLLEASGTGSWLLLVFSICLTPALCEEFLFRGYLQGSASLRLKGLLAWLLPGAYFALIHQNYFGLGALLVIGVYLAFLFEVTGSIFPGALVHFLYNGSIILLVNAESKPSWAYGSEGFVFPSLVLASLPLAVLAV